jgi:hypothetical protein
MSWKGTWNIDTPWKSRRYMDMPLNNQYTEYGTCIMEGYMEHRHSMEEYMARGHAMG